MDTRANKAVGYFFSVCAFGMFVYATFFSRSEAIQGQGIYWFGASLAAAVLPDVTRFRFKDLEVEFRKELARIEKKVDALAEAAARIRAEDSALSADQREERARHWRNYDLRLSGLSGDAKFELQRRNTLAYLRQYGASVREVQEKLAGLGFYTEPVDDVFTKELAAAVERYQASRNLEYVDGFVGEQTLEQLGRDTGDARPPRAAEGGRTSG